MITDSFFQQGQSHEVCEDYAIHGDKYVIISDGCSNGGGPRMHTDWGARILCKAAEQHLKVLCHGPDTKNIKMEEKLRQFYALVANTAKTQLKAFEKMSIECLTATLIVLNRSWDTVTATMMGDGVIGAKRKDGQWEVAVYDADPLGCKKGCFYLKYMLNNNWYKNYMDVFGGNFTVTVYIGDIFKPETMTVRTDKEVLRETSPWFDVTFTMDEYEMVFAASDGLTSFYQNVITPTSRHQIPVSTIDALREVLTIPKFNPDFLRHQREWLWKNKKSHFVRNDWHNSDDLSFGALYDPTCPKFMKSIKDDSDE